MFSTQYLLMGMFSLLGLILLFKPDEKKRMRLLGIGFVAASATFLLDPDFNFPHLRSANLVLVCLIPIYLFFSLMLIGDFSILIKRRGSASPANDEANIT